jgi:hypothetical protein
MPRKRTGNVATTVNGWAVELAIDQQTIQRRLTKAGIPPKPLVLYSARDVFAALHGDKEAMQLRKATAEAEQLERENLEAEKVLVRIEEVEKRVWQEILLPVKTELDLISDKLAALVNPENPDAAHKILTEWSDQVKKQINEKKQITKEKGKKK